METAGIIPTELQELVDAGTIRRTGHEFAIDALQHRKRTGYGWETVSYVLRIEEDDEGKPYFDIVEESRDHGNDVVESFDDPDDAAYWITNSLEEMEE